MEDTNFIKNCKKLMEAHKAWELWYSVMPEDSKPEDFASNEERLCYYSLPMALNYKRDSYKLFEACEKTYLEYPEVYNIKFWAKSTEESLRELLMKNKVAHQPNKHIKTWKTICETIYKNWGSFEGLMNAAKYDYVNLREIVQKTHKKWFPYLSWPKIFNYWSITLINYCEVPLKNKLEIEIAVDTHLRQASVKLWVINQEEAEKLSPDKIWNIWRKRLEWSSIVPIEIHSPLWFRSRNKFKFEL